MNLDYCHIECKKVEEAIKNNRLSWLKEYEDTEKNVVKTEYCVGGEYLHRGYYCPSSVIDLISGNIRRGRIVRRISGQNPSTFAYGFDKRNQLVTVKKQFTNEVIIRKNGIEFGITFSRDEKVENFSECVYDENKKIASYKYYTLSPWEERIIELCAEEYTYQGSNVIVDWYRYSCIDRCKPIMQHERYTFLVIDEYFASYTCDKYVDGEKVASVLDGRVFNVRVKRKA